MRPSITPPAATIAGWLHDYLADGIELLDPHHHDRHHGLRPGHQTHTVPAAPPTITATPTYTPQAIGPHYDRVPAGFCDRIEWEHLADSLHITVSETVFTDWSESDPGRAGGRLPWFAGCVFQADTRDGTFRPRVVIAVDVYETEAWARRIFQNRVSTHRDEFGYGSAVIHGWWDQGARSTYHRPYASDYRYADIVHHVQHNNLYVQISMEGGYRVEDPTGEEFLTLIDDLSLALIEQVTAYLSCRAPPGADATTDCH